MSDRPLKVYTNLDAKADVAISGNLNVHTTSSFNTVTISTSSNGMFDVVDAIHQLDQEIVDKSLEIKNAYEGARYRVVSFLDSEGRAIINLTNVAPEGSTYFTTGNLEDVKLDLLIDTQNNGRFKNDIASVELYVSGNSLMVDIDAPSAINAEYRLLAVNETILNILGIGGISGSSGVTNGSITGGEISASYVVLSATSSLANERVLTAGSGISIVDGGAGGAVTISVSGAVGGGVSAAEVTGALSTYTTLAGASGSFAKLVGNNNYNGNQIITGSLISSGSNLSLQSNTRSEIKVINERLDLVVTGTRADGTQILLDASNTNGVSQVVAQANTYALVQAGSSGSYPYYFYANSSAKFAAIEADDMSGTIYVGGTGYGSSINIGSAGSRAITIGNTSGSTITRILGDVIFASGTITGINGASGVSAAQVTGAFSVVTASATTNGSVTTETQIFAGNKIFNGSLNTNSPNTWDKPQRSKITSLTSSAGNLNIDLSTSNDFKVTLSQDTTLAAPTNAVEGQSGIIIINQNSSSAKTLSYNSFWKFPLTADAIISSNTGSINILSYYVISSSYAVCNLIKDIT